ncbi:MAG: DegT/DnrJ/EryC1/StrS family aminotransferase [candidate division Zixibacteria bacterium]|nr:DegT/DnrJ/EryC1/StrS family aminotransferase [candidate division Zixibacteria bacterium]
MKVRNTGNKIPLFDLSVSPTAKREVAATLTSGWLTTGSRVAAFEKAIGDLTKVRYAAAVSSATAGLQLALIAVDNGRDADVITTPFTFVATLEAIVAAGCRPVLADINPVTLNIDPDEVARKVSRRTRAVIPVDIAGYPADYQGLNDVCDKWSVPVIADAAHSFGASYKNRSIPALADAAVFSFYSTKNLTCGEGGMVVSRHKELVEEVQCLARHGLTSNAFRRKPASEWKYDATQPGFKANMSDIHAAVGLGQLGVFEKEQKRREKLAIRYLKNLTDLSEHLELPIIQKHYNHAWHLFIIKLHLSSLKIDRNRFIHLMAERGVECGVHYQPVFELSYYRECLDLSPQYFPNTAYAGRRVVSLPMFPTLKAKDVDYVCDCVIDILRKNAR